MTYIHSLLVDVEVFQLSHAVVEYEVQKRRLNLILWQGVEYEW